jgi:hypothetical protein
LALNIVFIAVSDSGLEKDPDTVWQGLKSGVLERWEVIELALAESGLGLVEWVGLRS